MARLQGLDDRYPTLASGALRAVGFQFLEADQTVVGTFNADVKIPAYGILLDVLIHNEEVWDVGTSATVTVGTFLDASGVISTEIDANGLYTAFSAKATDLTKGQSLAFDRVGGVAGAQLTEGSSSHYLNFVKDDPYWVRISLVTVGTIGTLGETYGYVLYAVPEMDTVTFTAT